MAAEGGGSAVLAMGADAAGSVPAYDPAAVEAKWRERWRQADAFRVADPLPGQESAFVLVAPPFTSGEAHMGHVRSYSIGDAHARFRRACGESVLFSLGFDAFGLPAELGAIEREMDPRAWVEQCAERMRGQFERLGFSFDWSRTFITSTPDMYRWSQWLFLKLLDAGLIERRNAQVDWCPSCRTPLSRVQVIDGGCWRCGEATGFVEQRHWFLRLSVYNEENDRRLADREEHWNPPAIAAQRALLGRQEGVEFDAAVIGTEPMVVFTPHADEIAHGAFIAVSPRHPELQRWIDGGEGMKGMKELAAWLERREDRGSAGMPVVDTGRRAQVNGIDDLLPIVVSPAVDDRYGPTAVLGIPSVDRGDAAIAERISNAEAVKWRAGKRPLLKRPAVRYRAADFPISRPRAWGAPVPIVHCRECGAVPVPLSELPVRLPEGLRVSSRRNALAEDPGFRRCRCPRCGGEAEREANTLDCHVDAFWIIFAVAVPAADRGAEFFGHPELRRWLPIAQFVQGADTGGFVLDERMVAKALRDVGVMEFLADGEPISRALMHDMVKLDGQKMSKHLGNVVNPEDLVERLGADTLRFAMLYAAAPAKGIVWNAAVLEHARAFLDRLWEFALARLPATRPASEATIEASTAARRRLGAWCATARLRITQNLESLELHRATRNVMILLERIEAFERRVLARREALSDRDREAVAAALSLLTRLLAPMAPHLAEELWSAAGEEALLAEVPWPAEAQS